MRRHGVDAALGQGPGRLGADAGQHLIQTGKAVLARQRLQPAFQQVVLVRRQHEAGAIQHQLAKPLIDGGHAQARRIQGAIWVSGRTASARPVFAAAPGMPQTTLVASS
ncbi:hypothetical protein D3C80_1615250 [compost metagenome]